MMIFWLFITNRPLLSVLTLGSLLQSLFGIYDFIHVNELTSKKMMEDNREDPINEPKLCFFMNISLAFLKVSTRSCWHFLLKGVNVPN